MLARLLKALGLLALLTAPAGATWSIVVVNTRTGEVAVGSATCLVSDNLALGLPCIVVGVGAGANQASGDLDNVVPMAEGLAAGLSPEEVLELVLAHEPFDGSLQAGIVSIAGGPPATLVGGNGVGRAKRGVVGQSGDLIYAIQGNVLAGVAVVDAAEVALLTAEGDLGQRLLASMKAAQKFGGDGRCSCGFQPTSCGAPPAEFEKSAHCGIMVMGRVGDPQPPCTSFRDCVTPELYMFLNVARGNAMLNDPDPVDQLTERYAVWRSQRIGRPDGILSRAYPIAPLPADGRTTRRVTVQLADIDGTPLTRGGARVTVEPVGVEHRVTVQGPVVDHGDGTYSFTLQAGRRPGVDRLAIRASDDLVSATLYPYFEARVVPVAARYPGGGKEGARQAR